MTLSNPMVRPLPYNVEAEEAVIGSLMIDNSAFRKVKFLLAEMFYRQKHEWLFGVLKDLHERNEPADPVTLCDELDRQGRLSDVGGPAAITELFMRVPTAIHVEYYARIVQRNAYLRGLVGAAERIARLAYEEGARETTELGGEAEAILHRATRMGSPVTVSTSVGEGAALVSERLHRILYGNLPAALPMPLPRMNRFIGGWVECEQTVMAARTGKGKTHFAVFGHVDLARRSIPSLYYSLEMYIDAISNRFVSCIGQIDNQQLRFGFRENLDLMTDPLTHQRLFPYRCDSPDELWQAVKRAEEELLDLPITIIAPKRDDTGRIIMPDFTPNGIKATLYEMADKHKVQLWTLDNLPRVEMGAYRDAAKRSNDLGDVSMGFRTATVETGTHMLCVHQLRKDPGESSTHEDFGESKKIADNADNAFVVDVGKDKKARTFRFSKYRNGEDLELDGIIMEGATSWFTDEESRRMVTIESPKPQPVRGHLASRFTPVYEPEPHYDDIDF